MLPPRVRTVGVEEEFLLFSDDWMTDEPAAAGQELADDPRVPVDHELKRQQAELASAPQTELAALADDLAARRRAAVEAAREHGARPAALATSPVPVRPTPSPDERYARLHRAFGSIATDQLACGTHVHVSVESRAEGVAALDAIAPWLPALVALAGNSPFWQGEDTGYASYRTVVWRRFPTAGPTEPFGDERRYDEIVAALVRSGAALDVASIYFDARLSERYPTVEIRVADVGQRVRDDVLVAGLCRGLVDAATAGELPPPQLPFAVTRAAGWRAARYGLSDTLVDPVDGRPRPAHTVLDRVIDAIRPALRRHGDEEAVRSAIETTVREGTGAHRQRRSGGPRAAVADAVEQFLA